MSDRTMLDVIKHSVAVHPHLFNESLREAARRHASYASVTHMPHVAKIATEMAEELYAAAQGDFSQQVQAFNIAARLQQISREEQQRIVARG